MPSLVARTRRLAAITAALLLCGSALGAAALPAPVTAAAARGPHVTKWHVPGSAVGTAATALGSLDADRGLVATPLQHGTRITLLDAARRKVVWSVVTKGTAVFSPSVRSSPTNVGGLLPAGPIVLSTESPRTRVLVLSRSTGRVLAEGPVGFQLLGYGRSDDPGALSALHGGVLLSDGATVRRLPVTALRRATWTRSVTDCGTTVVGALIVGGDRACSVETGASVPWQGAAGSAAFSFGGHLLGLGGTPLRFSVLDPATGATVASLGDETQNVALASSDLFLAQDGAQIRAFDLATGQQRWAIDGTLTQTYPRVPLPVASGAILVSVDGSKQHQTLLDAATGAVRGRVATAGNANGDFEAIPVRADASTLHLLRNPTSKNTLRAIDLATARTRWTYRFTGTAVSIGSRLVTITEGGLATLTD